MIEYVTERVRAGAVEQATVEVMVGCEAGGSAAT
jgi:hypothetical protein